MRTFPLQLKTTQSIDLINPLSKFINSKHGPDAFKSTQSTLHNMQTLRNGFDFVKYSSQIHNDYRLCAELEEKLVEYLKYVSLVDRYFSTEFSDPRGVKLPFPWSDSFQPQKKLRALSHSKYELVSVLYNLGVTYYIDGTVASTSIKDEDKLKALGKLRTCLWCLNELKQAMPTLLVNPQDIPSDIDITFINLLSNYVTGLCYTILLEIAEKDSKKYGPDRLASMNKVAAKHFKVALDITSATQRISTIPENVFKNLRGNLVFFAAVHRNGAYYQQAKQHIILQQDEDRVREGHMGLASSHLRQALNVINSVLADKKTLDLVNPNQKAELQRIAQATKEQYDQVSFKNKNIFQDVEYPPEQLPEIPDEKMVIGPIEPKEWKNKLDDEKNFECFLSPELKAVKQEFFHVIDLKKQEVDNNLKNANNLRNKHYAEGYINYLIGLDGTRGKKNELPPQIKSGLDKFHKDGGVSNYTKIIDHIGQASKNCKALIEQVKEVMNKERQDDEEMRKKFPQAWNRPHSEAINQDNIIQLKDLEQKYYIAMKADEEVLQKYQRVREWMERFSQPHEQILLMLNPTSDTDFYNENKDKIEGLQKQHQQLNQLIELEPTKELIRGIVDNYKKKNLIQEYQSLAAMSPQDRKEAIQKMLQPLDGELSKITQRIQDAYPVLDQMVRNAKSMNENRSSQNQGAIKVLEDMSQAINLINEVFDDLAQGSEFYNNLSYYLNSLQRTVSDFCIAREIDKQNRVQDLESNKNYQQFNVQKPFFTEENMKFAQGSSTYIPSNQIGKGPQQPQQPQQQQGQFQQSQQSQQPPNYAQSNLFGGPSHPMGIQNTNSTQFQQYSPNPNLGYPSQQMQGHPQQFQQQPSYGVPQGYPGAGHQGYPGQQQGYPGQQGGFPQQTQFGYHPQQQQSFPQQSQQQQQPPQQKGPFAGFSMAESTYVPNPNQKK